jgi:hypothetical protein
MRKTGMLLIFTLLLVPVACMAQGLTDEKIIEDYRVFMASPDNAECMGLIKPKEIRIVERRTEEKNDTVKIMITSDWVGEGNKTFYSGPCAGFRKSRGNGQSMWHHMYYELKGKEWTLVGIR